MKSDAQRSVGRPRSFDRTAALDVAVGLFWQRGYEGVSFADLTAAIGVASPSLYAAFGDKRSLFRAAVERYEDREGRAMAAALSDEPTAARAIGRMFDAAAAAYLGNRANTGRGCMVSTALLGCAEELGDLADLLRARRAAGEGLIRERLERGVREGDLREATDAATLARFFSAVLQGMAVHARDGATEADLRDIGRNATRVLDPVRVSGADP